MTGRPRRSTLFPHPTLSRSQTVSVFIRLPQPPQRKTPPESSQYLLPADEGLLLSRMASLAASTHSRGMPAPATRSEEHTSELQSRQYLVCRLLLEKKKTQAC